jgi:hypothetical protein
LACADRALPNPLEVVEKRIVARERVRLDTVSDQRQASEDARKEQLQVDDHDQPRRQDQR